MRRRPGQLTPLELSIIGAILSLRSRNADAAYGFLIAKEIKEGAGARYRTAHGTLYKTLERLERGSILNSSWEDASLALGEGRPRRRLYELTPQGQAAYAAALRAAGRTALAPEIRGVSA